MEKWDVLTNLWFHWSGYLPNGRILVVACPSSPPISLWKDHLAALERANSAQALLHTWIGGLPAGLCWPAIRRPPPGLAPSSTPHYATQQDVSVCPIMWLEWGQVHPSPSSTEGVARAMIDGAMTNEQKLCSVGCPQLARGWGTVYNVLYFN